MPKKANAGFYARFLGGFFLEYEGKRIIITKNMKQKSMQLLLILLKAGREGVSRKELIEMLEWRGNNWDRNLNNLRRQTCNLRKAISEAGFPEGEYIQSLKGRYYFSLGHKVETDTGKLDRLYRKARKQIVQEEREETLWEISKIYQGEFLPFLVAEEWALVENAHYRSIYSRCVNELCRILKGRGDYTRLLQLCTTASQIHPYDEWQAVQIDCLVANNQHQDANQICRQANELFTRELGIAPFYSDGSRKNICRNRLEQDDEVMEKVMAGLLEEDEPKGAYQCNYPQFIDVYRFLMRMSERGQIKLSLLLCTLKPAKAGAEDGKETEGIGLPADEERFLAESENSEFQSIPAEQMERFGKLLAKSIRENDVYTHYSLNQYLVLLASFGENREQEVTGRLRQGWKIFEKEEGFKVELDIQALESPSRKEAI